MATREAPCYAVTVLCLRAARQPCRTLRNLLLVLIFVALGVMAIIQVIVFLTDLYIGAGRDRYVSCIGDGAHLISRKTDMSARYPKHIHQIFFNITGKPMRADYKAAQAMWLELNPDFKHTLWNSSMVLNLLRTHYPDLVPLYNSYSDWVTQIDVAKLVLLYHFGGTYLDTDIRCIKPLRGLYDELSHKFDTVLVECDSRINTEIIISKSGSDFLAHAISCLKSPKDRYVMPTLLRIWFTAGPGYVYWKYRTYVGGRFDVTVIKRPRVLKYIEHAFDGTWVTFSDRFMFTIVIPFKDCHREAITILLFLIVGMFYMRRRIVNSLAPEY